MARLAEVGRGHRDVSHLSPRGAGGHSRRVSAGVSATTARGFVLRAAVRRAPGAGGVRGLPCPLREHLTGPGSTWLGPPRRHPPEEQFGLRQRPSVPGAIVCRRHGPLATAASGRRPAIRLSQKSARSPPGGDDRAALPNTWPAADVSMCKDQIGKTTDLNKLGSLPIFTVNMFTKNHILIFQNCYSLL